MRAAAREGPKIFRPASQNASEMPLSGLRADDGQVDLVVGGVVSRETRSSAGMSTVSAMREMPTLPGAAYIWAPGAGSQGLDQRVLAPPLPTTSTFMASRPRSRSSLLSPDPAPVRR